VEELQDALAAVAEAPIQLDAGVMQFYKKELLKMASTIKELRDALDSIVDPKLSQPDAGMINSFEDQLLQWQKPFTVRITTLSGAEAEVECKRTDTVAHLRERAATPLGIKEYRLNLVSRAKKLEPYSSTLEELGVVNGDEDLAAHFGQIDRWQELTIAEFLELATTLDVVAADITSGLQKQFDAGKLKREQVQTRQLIWQIEQAEEVLRRKEEVRRRAEEERRKREEDERLRQEELKKTLLQAVEAHKARELQKQHHLELPPEVLELKLAKDFLEQKTCELQQHHESLMKNLTAMRADLEADLGEALPALEAAQEKLCRLRKQDLQELMCFIRPPPLVALTMQALCILFGQTPRQRTRYDYFLEARKTFLGGSLLQMVQTFDKDNIPSARMKRLMPVLNEEGFSPEEIGKCSLLCSSACRWIHSIVTYHFVNEAVGPKKDALKEAEQTLRDCQREQDVVAMTSKDAAAKLSSALAAN